MTAAISISPQLPWHRLIKRDTIEWKNSSWSIFSGTLESCKVNNFTLSFFYLPGKSNSLRKSSFLVATYHSASCNLILGYQTGHLKSAYISETVQHVSFELQDPSNAIWQNVPQTFCNGHSIYTERICKQLKSLFILSDLNVSSTLNVPEHHTLFLS